MTLFFLETPSLLSPVMTLVILIFMGRSFNKCSRAAQNALEGRSLPIPDLDCSVNQLCYGPFFLASARGSTTSMNGGDRSREDMLNMEHADDDYVNQVSPRSSLQRLVKYFQLVDRLIENGFDGFECLCVSVYLRTSSKMFF